MFKKMTEFGPDSGGRVKVTLTLKQSGVFEEKINSYCSFIIKQRNVKLTSQNQCNVTHSQIFLFCLLLCIWEYFNRNTFIWLYMFSLCDLQGITIVKPIVFGNVARYFGKKREEDGHTHQWSVYVKPYRNEVRHPDHLKTSAILPFLLTN